MKILFLGGDQRQPTMIRELLRGDREVHVVGFKNIELPPDVVKKDISDVVISEYDVIVFPVSGVNNDYTVCSKFDGPILLGPKFLSDRKPNAKVFSGIMTPKLQEMANESQCTIVPLMEDLAVRKQNSVPTVEGIIADVINNTDITISQSTIFVLGYGNVGKLLVDYLIMMGADVRVGVEEDSDFDYLNERGIKAIYTANYFRMSSMMNDSNIIINTVPTLLIDDEYMSYMRKTVYILDISSKPHGVDFDAAALRKIKCKLYQGIPSVVAPKTAGKILSRKIDSIIREVHK